MLNIEYYSAPQFFGLPYQHMMIDEDYKNVRVFLFGRRGADFAVCESLRCRQLLSLKHPY